MNQKKSVRRLLLWFLCAVAIAGSFVDTAHADIIVQNPLNPSAVGQFSNLGLSNQQIADNFSVGQNIEIESLSWFGRYGSDSVNVTDSVLFSIRIFEDAGGPELVPIATVQVAVDAVDTGQKYNAESWFSYSCDLSIPSLNPGTYWLSVLETDSRTSMFGDSQWLWADTTTNGLRAYRDADNELWTTNLDVNHAFTLFAVPEPCSLSLLALGGVALLRKR